MCSLADADDAEAEEDEKEKISIRLTQRAYVPLRVFLK